MHFALWCLLQILWRRRKDKKKEKKTAFKVEQYWFVLIKTGPKTDFDSVTRAGLFKGHMANMGRLYKDGILKVAGPFGKNEFTWRGILILDCKTKKKRSNMLQPIRLWRLVYLLWI